MKNKTKNILNSLLLIFLLFGSILPANALVGEGDGYKKPSNDFTFINVRQISAFENFLNNLFAISGIQPEYQPGQSLTLDVSEVFLTGKGICSGPGYLVTELVNPSNQYSGGASYFVGNNLESGRYYRATFTTKLPSNAQTGNWEIDAYFYCPSRDPINAKDYSSVDVRTFSVVSSTPSCTNECNYGANVCAGSGSDVNRYKSFCGNYDSDSCLEYSSSISQMEDCGGANLCSSGQCIPAGGGTGDGGTTTTKKANGEQCIIRNDNIITKNSQLSDECQSGWCEDTFTGIGTGLCADKPEDITCQAQFFKIENNKCVEFTGCSGAYNSLEQCQTALSQGAGEIVLHKGINPNKVKSATTEDLIASSCTKTEQCESGSTCNSLKWYIDEGFLTEDDAETQITKARIAIDTAFAAAGGIGGAALGTVACTAGVIGGVIPGLVCFGVLGVSGLIIGGVTGDYVADLVGSIANKDINKFGYCTIEKTGNFFDDELFKIGDFSVTGLYFVLGIVGLLVLLNLLPKRSG